MASASSYSRLSTTIHPRCVCSSTINSTQYSTQTQLFTSYRSQRHVSAKCTATIAGVAVDIATRYGLDGPGTESRWGWGARFSAPVQTGPGAHPYSYTMGTGSFPGVKRPGRDDHSPPSSAEVKERVDLYLYSPSGSSWPVLG